MGTAIKHPVPDRVKQSFVIFDIRALWRSDMVSVGDHILHVDINDPVRGSSVCQYADHSVASALLLPASGQFDEILTKDRRQQAPLIYDGGLDALDFVVSTR